MAAAPTDITDLRKPREPRRPTGGKSVRPVDAAALIVIDLAGRKPRLLMGKRHPGHRFMPNRVVFPGGRVDPSDRRMNAFGALEPLDENRLMARTIRPSIGRARALALCAIRETAEETGILVGETGLGAPEAPSDHWRPFAETGVFPALEGLRYVARAITPPGGARRFDARFFAVDARSIGTRIDVGVGPETELVETMWLTVDEALAAECADVTRVLIGEIAQRLDAGIERPLPVPMLYERHGRWLREEIA